MWFRKTVDIPRTWYRKPITINLGKISDEDIVYYNGVEIDEEATVTPCAGTLSPKS